MRLWSIHPIYLDPIGLTACWREALLARKVLIGETKAYRNHPQLVRFKNSPDPINSIEAYLYTILDEARKRDYKYDSTKVSIIDISKIDKIAVSKSQLEYEFKHLKRKLVERNKIALEKLSNVNEILSNPLFEIVDGEIAQWEIIK